MGSGSSSFKSLSNGEGEISRPLDPLEDPLSDAKETEPEVVVLGKDDFQGSSLLELAAKRPAVCKVKINAKDQEWIPTDNELIQLTDLASLTALDLSGCKEITRVGLTHFSQKPSRIRELRLDCCTRITDNFFEHIVHFRRLERLSLKGCFRVSDRGIEALVDLHHLRALDLSLEEPREKKDIITDATLHILSAMTRLEILNLECREEITNQGIALLVSLQLLTSLNLADTGLTDSGLEILRRLPLLNRLNVAGCRLTESALLHHLAWATSIKYLNVSRLDISDNFIHGLRLTLSLIHLNLSRCTKLTDVCAFHLNKMTSLRLLNVNDCPGILLRLHWVIQWGCIGLTEKALGLLGGLSNLTKIQMSRVLVSDCNDLLPFVHLRQLEMAAHSAEDKELLKLNALKELAELTLHLGHGDKSEPYLTITILGIKVQLIRRS